MQDVRGGEHLDTGLLNSLSASSNSSLYATGPKQVADFVTEKDTF